MICWLLMGRLIMGVCCDKDSENLGSENDSKGSDSDCMKVAGDGSDKM